METFRSTPLFLMSTILQQQRPSTLAIEFDDTMIVENQIKQIL